MATGPQTDPCMASVPAQQELSSTESQLCMEQDSKKSTLPVTKLHEQLSVARNELKNIRVSCESLKRQHHKFVAEVGETLQRGSTGHLFCSPQSAKEEHDLVAKTIDFNNWTYVPIGTMHSSFKNKNGTPRQPTICQESTATLQLNKSILSNPDHALHGLEQFSHFWILFAFHKNDKTQYNKGKVAPPRLDGQRIGVFATRSPHRPNPIGLSLTKIVKIDGDCIHLSGVDIVDGTPVLDIKPYIPEYDMPSAINRIWEDHRQTQPAKKDSYPIKHENKQRKQGKNVSEFEISAVNLTDSICQGPQLNHRTTLDENCVGSENHTDEMASDHVVLVADWLIAPPVKILNVHFTNRCLKQIQDIFDKVLPPLRNEIDFESSAQVIKMIEDILKQDPRSVYRRNHCKDQLYFFEVNNLHITCWFDVDEFIVEVLKVSVLK